MHHLPKQSSVRSLYSLPNTFVNSSAIYRALFLAIFLFRFVLMVIISIIIVVILIVAIGIAVITAICLCIPHESFEPFPCRKHVHLTLLALLYIAFAPDCGGFGGFVAGSSSCHECPVCPVYVLFPREQPYVLFVGFMSGFQVLFYKHSF